MAGGRTSSLFHFTRRFDHLCSILREGFHPRYSLEDIAWVSWTDYQAFPVVCFCDIPISRLSEHTGFYGGFGIGMKREWGISEHLNPVMYVSEDSYALEPIKELFANPNPDLEHAKADILMTMAHMKPLSGRTKRKGKIVRKDFYAECEWRFLDVSNGPLMSYQFNNKKHLAECHKETSKLPLTFSASDIAYLLVPSEKYVAKLAEFLSKSLRKFPRQDRMLLTTRIIALDSIDKDF